jgi:hypothetical protein
MKICHYLDIECMNFSCMSVSLIFSLSRCVVRLLDSHQPFFLLSAYVVFDGSAKKVAAVDQLMCSYLSDCCLDSIKNKGTATFLLHVTCTAKDSMTACFQCRQKKRDPGACNGNGCTDLPNASKVPGEAARVASCNEGTVIAAAAAASEDIIGDWRGDLVASADAGFTKVVRLAVEDEC